MNRFAKHGENEALFALIGALNAKDSYKRAPISRDNQANFIKKLLDGFKLEAEFKQHILNAVLIHDIGMIGVPDSILLKPEPLSSHERHVIEQAPKIAADILAMVPSLSIEREMILHQNECWNGAGYPDGLRGRNIPVGARFISVAQAIDAMTHDRAYRRARPMSYCLQELQINSGKQFDPGIAKAASILLCKSDNGLD